MEDQQERMPKRQKMQGHHVDWENTTCITITGTTTTGDVIFIGDNSGKRQKQRRFAASTGDETAVVVFDDNHDDDDDDAADDDADENTVSLLQQLLSPLDLKTFFKHCFRACAVHVKASRDPTNFNKESKPDEEQEEEEQVLNHHHRFCSIINEWLYNLDPRTIYKETASESIFVWLQQPETGRIHSIEIDNAETAFQLYQAGHATYCRAPAPLEQTLVQSLLIDTGLGCGQYDPTGQRVTTLGRGEVEIFLSRTAGHVTNWHYDFQENFTLQLSGIKRWKVQKSTIRHPLRGCTPHYTHGQDVVESQLLAARLADPTFQYGPPVTGSTAIGPMETIDLYPGDCFYFPAGMWHTIEVIEPGVSINISLMATNYATITCQALQHLLLSREEWRECLHHNTTTSVVEQLQTLLETLPNIVRDFCTTHGAGAILPPCLVQPPPHTNTMDGNHNKEPMQKDDDEMVNEEEDEEIADDDDEEEEITPPIVVSSFEATFFQMPVALRTQYCKQHRLVINPLASLLHEEQEILPPYNNGMTNHHLNEPTSSTGGGGCTFVLNVTFAGTETHESLVRQRFLVSNKSLLVDMINERNDSDGLLSAEGTILSNLEMVRLVDFLVHYGYLQWKDL